MPIRTTPNGPAPTTTPATHDGPRPATTPGAPAAPADQGWKPKSNDQVLFVAMNNSREHLSTYESDQLKARGTDVRVVKDAPQNDTITTRDAHGVATTHDLATPEGAKAFALTLGLPGEQTAQIADVLLHGGADARDELAQIAQVWARAELGGQAPSRLVLSGHHVGYGVYGENNGALDWPTVGKLAEAMPRGARTVEDLMIAGCYSGGRSFMDKYQGIFPNVKTIVAYDGSSPGSYSGATAHQKAWEKATRGGRDDIDRAIFQGMRKGENVTVWTRSHGFQDGRPPMSLDDQRAEQQRNRADFESALSGQAPIADAQSGPVRDFYSATQRLIQNPQTPPAERAQLEGLRDQTIRLLFYPAVSRRFGEAYAQKLDQGYQALGLPTPDFKTMTRAQALASMQQFQDKLAATSPAPDAASQLAPTLQAFKGLERSVIPDTWV